MHFIGIFSNHSEYEIIKRARIISAPSGISRKDVYASFFISLFKFFTAVDSISLIRFS